MARKRRRAHLRRSVGEQVIVRVKRKLKLADRRDGFIVAVGVKWVLMAQTSDGGFFDGFVAFRVNDVKSITRDKSFETTFAKTRPDWPPSWPLALDLDSTAGLIRGLADGGRLIGIQKEKERRAMWIGCLDEVQAPFVYLHEVRPDASWHPEPLGYKLKAITSVEVGTNYRRTVVDTVCGGSGSAGEATAWIAASTCSSPNVETAPSATAYGAVSVCAIRVGTPCRT